MAGKGDAVVPAEVLYYGCLGLFGLGHVQQAAEWIDAHGEATNFSTANLYLEALLHLHRRQVDEALGCWTGIVQSDPAETLADILIERIKSEEERTLRELEIPSSFEEFVPLPYARQAAHRPGRKFHQPRKQKRKAPAQSGVSNEFDAEGDGRPRAGRRFAPGRIIAQVIGMPGVVPGLVAIAVLAGVLIAVVYLVPGAFRPVNWSGVLEDRLPAPPSGGSVIPAARLPEEPRFEYGDRDGVLAEYNRARQLALQGRPNQARFLLGKIELSNATFEIKERALLLRDSLPYLRIEHFEDALTPDQVFTSPYLLRGSQVHWRGRVSEPTVGDEALRFGLTQAIAVDPPANPSIPSLPEPGADRPASEAEGEGTAPTPAPPRRVIVSYATTPDRTRPELKTGQTVSVFAVVEKGDEFRLLLRARAVTVE